MCHCVGVMVTPHGFRGPAPKHPCPLRSGVVSKYIGRERLHNESFEEIKLPLSVQGNWNSKILKQFYLMNEKSPSNILRISKLQEFLRTIVSWLLNYMVTLKTLFISKDYIKIYKIFNDIHCIDNKIKLINMS